MEQSYRTVKGFGVGELVAKKSKFYASVNHVTTEEEAIRFINQIKKENGQATHNVYAYQIREGNLSRYTDDGEPSMTAGIPTFEVFSKQSITDVCVVVTRYFGGTLLGTGGLVRAYSGACQEGLKAAGVIQKKLCHVFQIVCDYGLFGKVEYRIKTLGYTIIDVKYEANVTLQLYVEVQNSKAFCEDITETTNALCVPQMIDTKYVDEDVLLEEEEK